MSDPIDRAAEVITRAQFGLTTPSMSRKIADDLHAAGLLVTPAHDAAVAAKALREAGAVLDEMARVATTERRQDGWRAASQVLADMADGREGGESNA